jgi:type I restriction enzyme S subunit
VGGPFGSNLTTRDYVDDGVPVIRGTNLPQDSEFLDDGFVFVSEGKADALASNLAHPGDIVFTQRGTLGQVGIIPESARFRRYVVSQSQMKLTVNHEIVDPRFIYYFFRHPHTVQDILSRSITSGVPHINLGILKSFDIPLPPLRIQSEIVNILTVYDSLIENNRRRITLLEDSARLLYNEWFVRLRFPGHEHTQVIDGVPSGWRKMSLDEVLTLQRGFDLPSQDRVEGNIPIYGASGINGRHSVSKVAGPGIVTGRAGSLGIVHFVPGDFWPLNTSLWVKEFRQTTPFFALHLLRSMNLERYGQGATMPMLDRKVVHKVDVLMPSPSLMAIFDSFASNIQRQINTLELHTEKLRTARNLLLPRLMSGELLV